DQIQDQIQKQPLKQVPQRARLLATSSGTLKARKRTRQFRTVTRHRHPAMLQPRLSARMNRWQVMRWRLPLR
ncbi:MAG TPA: hypothetical protein DEP10_13610, partial [Alphaproteobacteria bacterium]|nr:hypothetical protein [Alphaproteobacteria bacterium]